MGTPQAAVPSLERLISDGHDVAAVYTQPDRPSGRGNKIVFSPVKQFSLDHGLRVFQPAKIRTTEALVEFLGHGADAAIVVAYGRILPSVLLEAYPNGAINVHFSLLPKYRGAAPVNWAIVNGETETGVTTMKMDAGLDTGDILLQKRVPIGTDETSIELMERMSQIGADLLSDTIRDLANIKPRPQDDGRATFAPILKREDGRIDWTLDAAAIVNRVRGFQPFPGSYSYRNRTKFTVWEAHVEARRIDFSGKAGSVAEIGSEAIVVRCGNDTYVSMKVLQPEAKKRMNAADFVNGTRLKVGEVFGD